MSVNNDAGWIGRTLRRRTMRNSKTISTGNLGGFDESGFSAADRAERKATLKVQQLERRKSRAKMRTLRASKANFTAFQNVKQVQVSNKSPSLLEVNSPKPELERKVSRLEMEFESPEAFDDGYDSQYDSQYDTEEEELSEEELSENDEDLSELNEENFNKLLQLRMNSTDHQLEAFCLRYIFILKKEGVEKIHQLADAFEDLCRLIYLPLLKPPTRQQSKTKKNFTMRRSTFLKSQPPKVDSPKINVPKELPIENEQTVEFLKEHSITFQSEELKQSYLKGLHIFENCCFLQFLMLYYREMIIEGYIQRWGKTSTDVQEQDYGGLILEEFFMPPLSVEPKLDTELVNFSKLMNGRQVEINKFKKKILDKQDNAVAFNILKNELHKYVKELEEKIKISEIYFAAAIMRVRQKQQKELDKIFDLIEADDEAEFMMGDAFDDI